MCAHTHTNLYIYIYLQVLLYVTTCVFIKLNMGSYCFLQHKSVIAWLILDSYFWLSVTSHCKSETPGSRHLSFIYLIVQLQYICIVVSELLIQPIWEMTFEIECLFTVPFDFIFTEYTHLQSYFGQHLSLVPISEVISQICSTVRFQSQSALYPRIHQLHKCFFLNFIH